MSTNVIVCINETKKSSKLLQQCKTPTNKLMYSTYTDVILYIRNHQSISCNLRYLRSTLRHSNEKSASDDTPSSINITTVDTEISLKM